MLYFHIFSVNIGYLSLSNLGIMKVWKENVNTVQLLVSNLIYFNNLLSYLASLQRT